MLHIEGIKEQGIIFGDTKRKKDQYPSLDVLIQLLCITCNDTELK